MPDKPESTETPDAGVRNLKPSQRAELAQFRAAFDNMRPIAARVCKRAKSITREQLTPEARDQAAKLYDDTVAMSEVVASAVRFMLSNRNLEAGGGAPIPVALDDAERVADDLADARAEIERLRERVLELEAQVDHGEQTGPELGKPLTAESEKVPAAYVHEIMGMAYRSGAAELFAGLAMELVDPILEAAEKHDGSDSLPMMLGGAAVGACAQISRLGRVLRSQMAGAGAT